MGGEAGGGEDSRFRDVRGWDLDELSWMNLMQDREQTTVDRCKEMRHLEIILTLTLTLTLTLPGNSLIFLVADVNKQDLAGLAVMRMWGTRPYSMLNDRGWVMSLSPRLQKRTDNNPEHL